MKTIKDVVINHFRKNGLLDSKSDQFKITFAGDSPAEQGVTIELVELVTNLMNENPLTKLILDVRNFCESGGQEVNDEPKPFDFELWKLRLSLISEEYNELKIASAEHDEIEERDAIIDLMYVISGYALQRGVHSKLNEDWNEIQKSNMSKFCEDLEDAKYTEASYKRQNVNCERVEMPNGKFVVKSLDSVNKGKVLKSVRYRPAKLIAFDKDDKAEEFHKAKKYYI